MREIDYILNEFVEAEYSIMCLLQVMDALCEQAESKESREMENTLFIIKKVLTTSQKELQECIEKLDKYIIKLSK